MKRPISIGTVAMRHTEKVNSEVGGYKAVAEILGERNQGGLNVTVTKVPAGNDGAAFKICEKLLTRGYFDRYGRPRRRPLW